MSERKRHNREMIIMFDISQLNIEKTHIVYEFVIIKTIIVIIMIISHQPEPFTIIDGNHDLFSQFIFRAIFRNQQVIEAGM